MRNEGLNELLYNIDLFSSILIFSLLYSFRYFSLQAFTLDFSYDNMQAALTEYRKSSPKNIRHDGITSGYHQIALADIFQEYTAFITPRGLNEFTRDPFGLKGTSSYFQELMRNKVLSGLL
jgi:hypothetical protein